MDSMIGLFAVLAVAGVSLGIRAGLRLLCGRGSGLDVLALVGSAICAVVGLSGLFRAGFAPHCDGLAPGDAQHACYALYYGMLVSTAIEVLFVIALVVTLVAWIYLVATDGFDKPAIPSSRRTVTHGARKGRFHALLGFAAVSSGALVVAGAGWLSAQVARAQGLLPGTWDPCGPGSHGLTPCVSAQYTGPHSFAGYFLWGVGAIVVLALVVIAAVFLLDVLEKIGRLASRVFGKIGRNVARMWGRRMHSRRASLTD